MPHSELLSLARDPWASQGLFEALLGELHWLYVSLPEEGSAALWLLCVHRHHTRCTVSHLPYLCSDGSAALAGTSVQVEVKQKAWVSDIQVCICINPSF